MSEWEKFRYTENKKEKEEKERKEFYADFMRKNQTKQKCPPCNCPVPEEIVE